MPILLAEPGQSEWILEACPSRDPASILDTGEHMVRTHQQTHDAGRHFAVAEALMRGYKATLIGRSSYIDVNGHKAQVQVAAKRAWQIDDVDLNRSALLRCGY